MWSKRMIPAGFLFAMLVLLLCGSGSANARGIPGRSRDALNARERMRPMRDSLRAEPGRSLARRAGPARVTSGAGVEAVGAATAMAGTGAQQPFSLGVPDGAGGMIVVWEDRRRGESDIYAQRLDADGVPQWAANGVAVCAAPGDQWDPALVAAGSGGAFITWTDSRSGADYYDIYAQWMNEDGAPQWTADGVAVCVAEDWQEYPALVADGLGGAIVTWQDYRSGTEYDIYAQLVDASGQVQWGTDGVVVCAAEDWQEYPALVADGSGGAIVTWMDDRSGTGYDIYAQRVNAGGAVQWVPDVAVCAALDWQEYPALVTDGLGGAIVTWQDYRDGQYDIYAQRVNADGGIEWTLDGEAVCAAADYQWYPALVADGEGGAFITWEDYRNGFGDIYAQRVNVAGEMAWTTDGEAVCANAAGQQSPALVADVGGGVIVAWMDYRNGSDPSIYAQRMNASGAVQWTGDGVVVCPPAGWQDSPVLVADGLGGAIVAWKDYRSDLDEDTYAQRLNFLGSRLWAGEGVPVHLEPGVQHMPASAPSPDGGVFVVWSEKRGSQYDVFVKKYDAEGAPAWATVPICTASGRQAVPRIAADGSGGAVITWEDYRSGVGDIYAQRVNAGGVLLWTADGVAVCTAAGERTAPALISDGSGGAIVTWTDYRSGPNSDIYAQRVNSVGEVQWAVDGAVVCMIDNSQRSPALIPDGAGGAIVTWTDYRSGPNSDIYAQRVSGSGLPAWTLNGEAVCLAAVNQWSPALVSDGSGGAIVTWTDNRSGTNSDIYARRVNAAGVPQWAPNGVVVCTAAYNQWYPALVAAGAGGAIVTWEDDRSGSGDIYAQLVNTDGDVQWTADGVAVCAAAGWQEYPALVTDGSGGAIVTWTDDRSGSGDIYAQQVNAGGVPQWLANGVAVCSATGWQVSPVLVSDGSNGAILAWEDWRGGNGSYLYTQRLNGSGASQWSPSDGVVPTLLSLVMAKAEPGRVRLEWFAASGGAGQATLYRRDKVADWSALATLSADGTGRLLYEDRDIEAGMSYGYRVGIVEDGAERFLGETWVEVPGGLTFALEGARPNPVSAGLSVAFTLASAAPATLEVVDLGGRRIISRAVGSLGAGRHLVRLDEGNAVAPGLYLVRLTQGNQSLIRKACVVR